jgi:hypothetical protein
MTALYVAVPIVIVALALAWHRVASERAERQSVESYERALDVLGDVTKRSDASAAVQLRPKGEVARPHVRPARSSALGREIRSDGPAPITPIAPPPLPARREPLVFGDDDLVGESAASPTPRSSHPSFGEPSPTPAVLTALDAVDQAPPRRPRRHSPNDHASGHQRGRRLGAGVALLVFLGAVGFAISALAGEHGRLAGGEPSSTTTVSRGSRSTTTTNAAATTTTLTASGELAPTSVSSSTVTYTLAASDSYQLSFVTSGVCWIGVESSAHGPYLWMQTLGAGETTSYTASGPVVVRLGAPTVLSVRVNGTPIELPNQSQPYNVVFSVPGPSSARS